MELRENGYLIINGKKINENKNRGSHYGFWIQYNNEEYYFKTGTIYELYTELFYEEIAKILKIPTVSYDLAKIANHNGVICKNFNSTREKVTTMLEILTVFYEEVICNNQEIFQLEMMIENTFNLEDIWMSLDYYYRNHPQKEKIVQQLMDQIVTYFIFQLLSFNSDFHFENLIILGTEVPRLSPNFDYGSCGLVNIENNDYNFFLSVTPFKMVKKTTAKDIIEEFITLSDKQYTKKLKEYASKIQQISILEIFKNIEKKINTTISQEIKQYLSLDYKKKILQVINIINKYFKEREYNLRLTIPKESIK